MTTIKELTLQTEWDSKFSAEYAWQRASNNYPELFVLAQANNHEERTANWLISQNINDWLDNHKNPH